MTERPTIPTPPSLQGDDAWPARPRPAFWLVAIGLVLAWLYCLLAVVVFLAYGDSAFARLFGGACAAGVVVLPVWTRRAIAVARRGGAPGSTPVREMRTLYAIAVSVGVAYAAALFILGAGEWSTAPVG